MKIKYKTLRYNFLKVGQCEQTPHIENITPLSGYWISILTYQQNLIKYCINRCIPTPVHRKETKEDNVLPIITIALSKVGRKPREQTYNHKYKNFKITSPYGKPRNSFGQMVNTKTSPCRSPSSIHYNYCLNLSIRTNQLPQAENAKSTKIKSPIHENK